MPNSAYNLNLRTRQ